MVWDFAEANPFSTQCGNWEDASIAWIVKSLDAAPVGFSARISQIAAQQNNYATDVVVSTDPPYYDNIGYADLSDFFYVWLKSPLAKSWPNTFRRLTTPKTDELVATPYRHGGKAEAEEFFMQGMSAALTAMRDAAQDDEPLTIYYAFKQSELVEDGIVSAGWATFLQAVVDADLAVDGTWPVRTERGGRTISIGSNALASSVVLACRKRPAAAPTATRSDFLRALRREMPDGVEKIRKAGVGPVDMPQSVIGPGMGVFTRHASVLEDDDTKMSVRTALALINRVWGEIEDDIDTAFDPETQVALAWFSTYGFDPRPSGDLINIATRRSPASRRCSAPACFSICAAGRR